MGDSSQEFSCQVPCRLTYLPALLSILHHPLLPPNLVPSHQRSLTRALRHHESPHAPRRYQRCNPLRLPNHPTRLLCTIHDRLNYSSIHRHWPPFNLENRLGFENLDRIRSSLWPWDWCGTYAVCYDCTDGVDY